VGWFIYSVHLLFGNSRLSEKNNVKKFGYSVFHYSGYSLLITSLLVLVTANFHCVHPACSFPPDLIEPVFKNDFYRITNVLKIRSEQCQIYPNQGLS